MKKLKFLHAADLHLDSPFVGLQNLPNVIFNRLKESTFKSLQKMIDLAIREKVDFVILAGDLYDQEDRSIRAQVLFRKEMERLRDYDIQAYIIHGNHDHTSGNWIELEWPENVHIFLKEEVEIKTFIKENDVLASLYGFSYGQRAVTEKMINYYQKSNTGTFHIGLLHGNLEGQKEHDHYAPFKLSDLIEKDFDYWALGHIHKRQVLCEQPPVIYPGNIQGRNKKETGEKGCYIVSLTEANSTYTFYNTADIIWEWIQIQISPFNNIDELLTQCFQEMKKFRHEQKGTFLSIAFVGSGSLSELLEDTNLLEDIIHILNEEEDHKYNFVWVASVKNETTKNYDRNQLKSPNTFIGELLAIVDDYSEFNDVFSSILTHPQARKFVETFSPDELKRITEEAESLLIHELLRERTS